VLKLLLQPLVENALYHGIKNKRGKGHLTVRGWSDGGELCFSVSDNGIGMTEERLEDVRQQICASFDPALLNGVYGLYNVNKRLALYYGEQARIEIQSTHKEGTTVSFRVSEVDRDV
ncbi:MAG: ATP-binding protein, partial [Spirochaetota bacterium]